MQSLHTYPEDPGIYYRRIVSPIETRPLLHSSSQIYQPMVDWWFGLVVGIAGIPLSKGLLFRGTHRIPNHQPKPPINH